MTITTFLMILALAVGAGTSYSISSETSTSAQGTDEPEFNCFINGTWYNPCPADSPWDPGLEQPPM